MPFTVIDKVNEADIGLKLFGNLWFISVPMAISHHKNPEFIIPSLDFDREYHPNILNLIKRLIRLEMVENVQTRRGGRRFRRISGPLWEVIEAAEIALLNLKRDKAWDFPRLDPWPGDGNRLHELMDHWWSPLMGSRTMLEGVFSIYLEGLEEFSSRDMVNLPRLCELGMVEHLEGERWDKYCSWRRLPSPIWGIVHALWWAIYQLEAPPLNRFRTEVINSESTRLELVLAPVTPGMQKKLDAIMAILEEAGPEALDLWPITQQLNDRLSVARNSCGHPDICQDPAHWPIDRKTYGVYDVVHWVRRLANEGKIERVIPPQAAQGVGRQYWRVKY